MEQLIFNQVALTIELHCIPLVFQPYCTCNVLRLRCSYRALGNPRATQGAVSVTLLGDEG